MNCPKCGELMEEGRIRSARAVGHIWWPKNQKARFYVTSKRIQSGHAIELNKPDYGFGNLYLTTFICRKCKLGVFSYD